MNYIIKCSCGQQMTVDESMVNREARCVKCLQALIVPPAPGEDGQIVPAVNPSPMTAASGLKPHRGPMILAFGIASLVMICLAPFLGTAALIMGNADLGDIRNGKMDPSGKSLVEAGRVCAIIGLVISIVFFVLYIGIFVFAFGLAFLADAMQHGK